MFRRSERDTGCPLPARATSSARGPVDLLRRRYLVSKVPGISTAVTGSSQATLGTDSWCVSASCTRQWVDGTRSPSTRRNARGADGWRSAQPFDVGDGHTEPAGGERRVFMCQSRDYVNWSEPRLILAPDPVRDNLDVACYGTWTFRMGWHWIWYTWACSTRCPTHRRWNLCIAATGNAPDTAGKPTHDSGYGLGDPGSSSAQPDRDSAVRGHRGTTRRGCTSASRLRQHDLWYAEDQDGFGRLSIAGHERPSIRAGRRQAAAQWLCFSAGRRTERLTRVHRGRAAVTEPRATGW